MCSVEAATRNRIRNWLIAGLAIIFGNYFQVTSLGPLPVKSLNCHYCAPGLGDFLPESTQIQAALFRISQQNDIAN
jgi:hypothetical protein